MSTRRAASGRETVAMGMGKPVESGRLGVLAGAHVTRRVPSVCTSPPQLHSPPLLGPRPSSSRCYRTVQQIETPAEQMGRPSRNSAESDRRRRAQDAPRAARLPTAHRERMKRRQRVDPAGGRSRAFPPSCCEMRAWICSSAGVIGSTESEQMEGMERRVAAMARSGVSNRSLPLPVPATRGGTG